LVADQVPLRESGGAAQAWGWAGGWAARADEASLADKKGWEYTGLKGALAGRRARKAVWVGEPFAGALFRRRCWERTQRRYLNPKTADAARVRRELAARTVGLAELQGFCGLLGVKIQNPARLTDRAFLERRLGNVSRRLTANPWSACSTFSRTVWRLYGGAKGLAMWYYHP
jgi:hypothetical protein